MPPTGGNRFGLLGEMPLSGPGGKRRKTTTEMTLHRQQQQIESNQPRFITLQTTPEKPLRKNNIFVVEMGVEAISTEYSKVSWLRDGSLLVLCNSQKIADRFLKATSIGGIPVKIELHNKLNCCKGMIFAPSLIDLTEEEIKSGLKKHGVVEVVKLTRDRDGEKRPSGLLIVTFDLYKLPESIRFGFEQIEVREYIPNPMRCKKCQLLGHTIKRCESEREICATCAEVAPHEGQCSKTECVNCKNTTHASKDPKCPEFNKQKEILKIQNKYRCSMFEARKHYYATVGKQVDSGKPSYAEVAKNITSNTVYKFTAGPAPSTSNTTKQQATITTAELTPTTTQPTKKPTTQTTTEKEKEIQQVQPTLNTIKPQKQNRPQQKENKKPKQNNTTEDSQNITEIDLTTESPETFPFPTNTPQTPQKIITTTQNDPLELAPNSKKSLSDVLGEHFGQFGANPNVFNTKNIINLSERDTYLPPLTPKPGMHLPSPRPDTGKEMETD